MRTAQQPAAPATTTSALQAAAAAPYFTTTWKGVSYRPTAEAATFTCAPHDWLAEYVIEDAEERIVGRRKTPAGALRLLVTLADAEVRKVTGR